MYAGLLGPTPSRLSNVFNLSGSEIIVILLLALVVLGPDKLPDAMRKAGRTFAELKKLSSGFQDEVRKGFEEPAKEVKKTAAAVRSAATFTGADTTRVKDKPRYNPAVDSAPELPPGSSVAEPLVTEPSIETSEVEVVTDEPPVVADEGTATTELTVVADEAAATTEPAVLIDQPERVAGVPEVVGGADEVPDQIAEELASSPDADKNA